MRGWFGGRVEGGVVGGGGVSLVSMGMAQSWTAFIELN